MLFSGKYITGRKVAITAHDKAIVIFFTPVISFNRGILLDNFTLYRTPINKGKIRITKVIMFSWNPSINESMKERTTKNFKNGSIFFMRLALSGLFIASSFRSVNLFNPYIPNVIKKVSIAVYNTNILYNNPEKITSRKPFIARKSDVEIRNDINLFNIELIWIFLRKSEQTARLWLSWILFIVFIYFSHPYIL